MTFCNKIWGFVCPVHPSLIKWPICQEVSLVVGICINGHCYCGEVVVVERKEIRVNKWIVCQAKKSVER